MGGQKDSEVAEVGDKIEPTKVTKNSETEQKNTCDSVEKTAVEQTIINSDSTAEDNKPVEVKTEEIIASEIIDKVLSNAIDDCSITEEVAALPDSENEENI